VDAAEAEGGSTTIGRVAGEVATTGTATTHSTRDRITITRVVIRVIMAHLEADRTQMDAVAPGSRPTVVDTEVVVVATRINHPRTHLPDLLTLPLRQVMAGTVDMVVVEVRLRHLRMEAMAVDRRPPGAVHHPIIIILMTEMIAMVVTELAKGMGVVVDMMDVGAERLDMITAGVGMAVRVVVIEVVTVDTITLGTEGEEVEEAVVEVVTTNLCLRYLERQLFIYYSFLYLDSR